MQRLADVNGRFAYSTDMQSPPSRLSHRRPHAETDCSPQLRLLQELRDARLRRRKYLQAQVERNLVAEADLVQLASRRRQPDDDLTPQEQLISLRDTNKALRYKIREKEKLIQSLLKQQQQQPDEKNELQAMIARNKQYLEEIKKRNQQFKRELEGMYTADPRRQGLKYKQLKEQLRAYEVQFDEYQWEQLRLRQRIDQQRCQNSKLSVENEQIKQVLEEYEDEFEKRKSEHQSGSEFEERLTFLLTENTQIGLRMDVLKAENAQLKQELAKAQQANKGRHKEHQKRDRECEQLKQLMKQVREQYNAVLMERDSLSNELEIEQQKRLREQEQIANLNIQIRNLEVLRQLQLEEATEQRGEVKTEEYLKSQTEVLSLKASYDSTIKKLTDQNEELMKQLQLVFEMKNRNEEELLKTLKLHEKLERENALLGEKVKSGELKEKREECTADRLTELKQKLDQVKLENVRLIGERESLLKQLHDWEERWSRKLTDQSSNQRNISVIERDYSEEQQDDGTSHHELQFLRDELESGHKNLNILKEQIEMSEYNIKLKSGQVKELERRISHLEQDLEEQRELRRGFEEKYTESQQRNRSREDEIEEILNKNAKQNQRLFEVTQKCTALQHKLEEQMAVKNHLAEERERLFEQTKQQIKSSFEKEQEEKSKDALNGLKEQILRLQKEKQFAQLRCVEIEAQLNSIRLQRSTMKNDVQEEHDRLLGLLEETIARLGKGKGNENADIQTRIDKTIQSILSDNTKDKTEVERLKQVSQELLNEIIVKDKEIEFLVGENTQLKLETEKALDYIKYNQKQVELEQECTMKVIIERMERSAAEVDELRTRLEEYEKQQNSLDKQKGNKQDAASKQLPPLPHNGKENSNQGEAHDYLFLLKDLKQYMLVNKLQLDDEALRQHSNDEGLCIIKSTKEQIRTLLSQNFLLREKTRKLEKELKAKTERPESDENLLSDEAPVKPNWERKCSSLQEELSLKEKQHRQNISKLEEYIVSRENEFAQRLSQLETELVQARQPARAAQEQSNIAWSDLRDSVNLDYSHSTVPPDSLQSNLESDNLQNLDDRNEERFAFQQQLRESISKFLNLETSKLAQLTLSAFSNLFLYPQHDQLMHFVQRFAEALRYYEQYESQRVTEMRSTIMEYCGRAEELLDDGDVNLLDSDGANPASQLSESQALPPNMHSSMQDPQFKPLNGSSSSRNYKRSKSKSSERKKLVK